MGAGERERTTRVVAERPGLKGAATALMGGAAVVAVVELEV